jgi:hypothetical protein
MGSHKQLEPNWSVRADHAQIVPPGQSATPTIRQVIAKNAMLNAIDGDFQARLPACVTGSCLALKPAQIVMTG